MRWTRFAALACALPACSFLKIVKAPPPVDPGRAPIVSNVAGNSIHEIEAVKDGLVILGDNFDTVTSVRLVGETSTQELEIRVVRLTSIEAVLTDDLPPGRYALEVENPSGVATFSIDFERGARGVTGDEGASGVIGPAGADAPQSAAACAAMVRSITSSGAVTCAAFDGRVQPTDGTARPHRYYQLQPIDFRPIVDPVPWGYDGLAIFRDGSAGQAAAMAASVHLPQGATIVDFACSVVDDDAGNDVSVELRHETGIGATLCGGGAAASSGQSNQPQLLFTAITGCTDPVAHDDAAGALGHYVIVLRTTAVTSAVRVIGCHVRFGVGSALP